MSELLSQDEVDALLKGVADGAIPASGEAGVGGAVRTLDLTNQEMTLRGRLPGLDRVLDHLVRALRRALGGLVGQLPEVGIAALELERYGTFIGRVQPPICVQLFRLAPLRGQGMLVLDPALSAALLQRLFGGSPGRRAAVAAREPSAIEQRVAERVGAQVLRALEEAFRVVEAIECVPVRLETNPAFVAVVPPQELVVRIDLSLKLDEGETGTITICVPNGTLDPVRDRLRSVRSAAPETLAPAETTWADRLREALADAECELSAELGSHLLSLREVLNLRTGDLLPLRTGRDGPVIVRVEGRARFLAAPGVSGGSNAVRVTSRL